MYNVLKTVCFEYCFSENGLKYVVFLMHFNLLIKEDQEDLSHQIY